MAKDERKAKLRNEEWALVAVGVAHVAWEEGDETEHDRWVDIAGRCTGGELTDDEWCEICDWHAEMTELYDDDEWWEL